MNSSTKSTAKTPRRHIPAGIMLMAAILFLSGCTATTSHRHHEYNPAPSVTIEYQYYPDVNVYYDVHRHLYLYRHVQRGWVTTKNLPHDIHIDRQRHHVIHTRHRRPWNENHAYKQQRRHDDVHRPNKRDERREKHDEKPPQGHDSRYKQPSERKVRYDRGTPEHRIQQKVRREHQQRQEQKYQARNEAPRKHEQVIQEDSHIRRNDMREDDHKQKKRGERKLESNSHHRPEQQGRKNPGRYDYHNMKRHD